MSHTLHSLGDRSGFYRLEGDSFVNNYYIISGPGTRELMASPLVVGFNSYQAMLGPTMDALKRLKYLDASHLLDRVNILTILRGGLNYPVEEACNRCGIKVTDMSFLSCERIIRNGVITGLDVKYEKLHTEKDCTLVIGDIIASGQTLELCLKHVMERFHANGDNIRKIVFFTIGGTKAVRLMEKATADIRAIWPGFEGFDCVFYEGMFTVYEDNGVTGVNTPDIDFGWKGGTISPEFRKYVLDYEDSPALLEKCIIYDGGARRYEIDLHYEEVMDYWTRLLKASANADMASFVAEKLGYDSASYSEWLALNHYPADARYEDLYVQERQYAERLGRESLTDVCKARIKQLEQDFKQFIS